MCSTPLAFGDCDCDGESCRSEIARVEAEAHLWLAVL